MKKVLLVAACLAGAVSLSAQACPAGTHPVGGTGPHHKGGTCVTNGASAKHAHHAKAKTKKAKHAGKHHKTAKKAAAPATAAPAAE